MSVRKNWECNDNPFYSDIKFLNYHKKGLQVYITAKASSCDLARKAALVFFNRIIDSLSLQLNIPLKVSINNIINNIEPNIRMIIEENDINQAYNDSLILYHKKEFQNALSWYRKGLNSEDIFDKFLAYWNSIEIIASKYHPDNDESNKGSKSQIWECFKLIWNGIEKGPIISNDYNWIKDNNEIRNSIAHGYNTIDINEIEKVSSKILTLQQVASEFILEWKKTQLNLNEIIPT